MKGRLRAALFFFYKFSLNKKHFSVFFVENDETFSTQTDQPMNQILYYNPRQRRKTFPKDTILKEKDHAGGYTDYYVFIGKTLVRIKRVNRKGKHYREIHDLKSVHGEHLKVKSGWWNPVEYRIDDGGYNTNVDTPAEFVEVKKHEADYARNQ